jgi:hypothetical protein
MADIQSRMREIVEATRWQTSAPGADAVWRRGHRRRRTKVAGGVVLLTVGLVATGTVGQALLRNPTRPTVGGTVAVPSSTPSRSLSCPKGPVACGESQGIRWQVRLLERGSFKVLGQTIKDALLGLGVGRQEVGRLRSPLPTSGNLATGSAFATPQGRLRAVWGILTPGTPPGRSDPGRIVRFSVGYGDATGRPTGAAEAITIPVRALRARIWVAFIPATAWLVGLDGFDAQGNPLDQAGASSACSTPPRLPLLTCRRAGPAPTSHG